MKSEVPSLPSYSPEFAESPAFTVGADGFVVAAGSVAAVVPGVAAAAISAVVPAVVPAVVVPEVPSVCEVPAVVPEVVLSDAVLPDEAPVDVSEDCSADVVPKGSCEEADEVFSVASDELSEAETVCVSVAGVLFCAQPDSMTAAAAATEKNLNLLVIIISFLYEL